MVVVGYLQNIKQIPLSYITTDKSERLFVVEKDILVTLSDGRELLIEKGFETDLSSIPRFLWSIYKPFDVGLLADIIHDKLWVQKLDEIKRYGNSYKARKFADEERKRWRNAIAPNHRTKNKITHGVIRLVGGYYYSGMAEIPT